MKTEVMQLLPQKSMYYLHKRGNCVIHVKYQVRHPTIICRDLMEMYFLVCCCISDPNLNKAVSNFYPAIEESFIIWFNSTINQGNVHFLIKWLTGRRQHENTGKLCLKNVA